MEQSKTSPSPCDAAVAAAVHAESGRRVKRSAWRRPGGSRGCGGTPPVFIGQAGRAPLSAYSFWAR